MTRLALVEGRGDIGDEATIRATLSHHALPDIPDRVIVEVRVRCDECFTPVIGAECDLLLRGELQAPVRTEVHQGICPEGVACPEVSIDIRIGGRRSGTMHDSEVVTTDTRYGLREQDDIAVLDACSCDLWRTSRRGTGHVAPRCGAVGLLQLLDLTGRQVFGDPLIEVRLIDPSGVACLEVFLHLPASDGLDDGTFAHQLRLEGLHIRREPREVIALSLEAEQEVVERGHDFDTLCCERLLPWALEVVDSELLLAIGLGLQGEEALHQLGELLKALGYSLEDVEPVVILLLRSEYVGINSSIKLGHTEGLREEAPHHTLWVSLPFLTTGHERQGSDDGDITLTQVFDDAIPPHHRDTSVREVDDEVR